MPIINIDDTKTKIKKPKPQINSVSWPPDFEAPGLLCLEEANSIKNERRPGIWYVNPVGTVHASVNSEEFARAVKKKQAEWYRLLSRQMKNGWRRQKRIENNSWRVAFEYDGVVVYNSTILQLRWWYSLKKEDPTLPITNQQKTGSIPLLNPDAQNTK